MAEMGQTVSFTLHGDSAQLEAALTQATQTFNNLGSASTAMAQRMSKDVDAATRRVEARFGALEKQSKNLITQVKGLGASFGMLAGGNIVGIFKGMLQELTGIDNVSQLISDNLGYAVRQVLGLKSGIKELNHEYEQGLKLTQEQHAADSERFDRLKELQAIMADDPLNNAAVEEAQMLVNSLNSSYADLGMTVNGVTGKIEGLTEAQSEFVRIQRAIERAKLDAAIAEQKLNVDKATADVNNYQKSWKSFFTLDPEAQNREIKRRENIQRVENEKLILLQRQRDALLQGQSLTDQKNAAATARAATDAAVKAREEERAAQGRVDAMRAGMTDARLAQAQGVQQTAQDRVNAAIMAGGGPELDAARQALESAKQDVAKILVTVSGDEMKSAREERQRAVEAYQKAERDKVPAVELEKLLKALVDADKRVETANAAYTQAVAGIAPKDVSKVALDTSSWTATGGTFSAYSAQDLGTSTAMEQVKLLGGILKSLDAFRVEQREKEGGLL